MLYDIIRNPIFWIILTIIIFFLYKKNRETYSPAAMLQLTAKGPQDTYLSGDAWKYIPPWYYGYGGYSRYGNPWNYRYGGWNSRYPWYISTRQGKKPYYW
jgi:hypothetical protein